MHTNQAITLQRDCEAASIPDGNAITLREGDVVYITQALGGSYTININGNLARIEGKDADALGFEVEERPVAVAPVGDGNVAEAQVWEQLKTCFDPEISINIVDLGLIYKVEVAPVTGGGNQIDIEMTLTSAGCGMGQYLVEDARSKIESIPNVTEVNVEMVFDPPWSQEMMSEVARLETGLM